MSSLVVVEPEVGAQFPPGFTGHSGRIGMARRMAAAAIQNQGRWKHGDMVVRYTRREIAGEALKWLT